VVASSDDAIVGKKRVGVITRWNRGAERMYGYTEAEAVGQSIGLIIPSDRHDEELQIVDRVAAGEQIDHYETRRQRKDGTIIDVSLSVTAVRDQMGAIIGLAAITRDISERIRTAQSLIEILSTLTLELSDELLFVPIIGPVDAARAGRLSDVLLGRIQELRTRW
jgi:two-component system CheB/CheR fusion protein